MLYLICVIYIYIYIYIYIGQLSSWQPPSRRERAPRQREAVALLIAVP